MPVVSKERLKVLSSTKDIMNVMDNLNADGNGERNKVVESFFNKKEVEIESVFKEAKTC